MKVLINNKKAYHEYEIIETVEAGINLIGCEVKSLRQGEANLVDAFARVEKGQVYLVGCYIKNYAEGSFANVEERRTRRLLLHKNEIKRLDSKIKEKSYTLIPTRIYLSESLVKVEIGLARGKKSFDKRDAKRDKDLARSADRDIKDYKLKKR